jgi:4a-hydroxytetrahydrobiopterin dehydratase
MSAPSGWTVVDDALEQTFELPSFPEAIAFVNRVAELAEAENHHPDVAISYKKVTLRWTTHSEGGITDRDRDLAVRSAALA